MHNTAARHRPKDELYCMLRIFYVLLPLVSLCLTAPAVRAQSEGEAPPVRVAPVTTRTVQPLSWVSGSVVSRDDARIAAEIAGRLRFVAEVGQRLEAGEAVAEIEPLEFRLRVEEARAEQQRIRPRLQFYRDEEARLAQLADDDYAARNRREEIGSLRDELAGDLQAAGVRLQLAEDSLRKTRLLAPFAGVVVERLRTPGEQVQPGDEVLRLVDVRRREVQARVTAAAVASLQPGAMMRLRGPGGDEVLGRLRTVVAVGDRSRLYEIRVVLEDQDWPVGLPVRVAVPESLAHSTLTVPRDSLVIRTFGIHVFRIDGEGRSELVPVVPGYSEEDWIEVRRSTLAEGDRVVVRGNERLWPGQPVRILEDGAEEEVPL
ncbi:MAG: efflux RND transporter periplasmic adaptor subunit [Gammaproteobacteria bacterium]|nr:efflux RND transporter periplasmic adaptor subunit [Gammaproteobacteria bacterium]